ncbi:serine hydrolase domain-containing protein [Ningiella sp. W23]|uniref:serine hydrolase domain-containing protein n=1 Tax=Ningiella sp. W23 TaxID=3023715 RepID=UPI0037582526
MRIFTVVVVVLSLVCSFKLNTALASNSLQTLQIKKPDRMVILSADLNLIVGSGEFVQFRRDLSFVKPELLRFEWDLRIDNASAAHWEISKPSTGEIVLSGKISPAPKKGSKRTLVIDAKSFMSSSQPAKNQVYRVKLWPINGDDKKMGGGSHVVTLTHLSEANTPPGTNFGDGASFPRIALASKSENIRQINLTQLYNAHIDLVLQIDNPRSTPTDPMFLKVIDNSLLFRQNSVVEIPSIQANRSVTRNIRLMAILPPPQSQLPSRQQMRVWRNQHAQKCGAELKVQLNWRGESSQMPMVATQTTALVPLAWHDVNLIPPNRKQCSGGQCTSSCAVERELRTLLDGKVQGYSFALGQYPHANGGGFARRSDDGEMKFTGDTKVTVASISKWISAIGAMAILTDNNLNILSPIGAFFPPDWNVDPFFLQLTFDDLMRQRSGIMDYGNVKQDFAQIRAFMEQDVDPAWTTTCQPSSVINPANAVNMARGFCYSNYNAALLRILLPRVAGRVNGSPDSAEYDNAYEALINEFVFEPVGAEQTGCRPPDSGNYAFGYNRSSTGKGMDWGDVRDECGAAGWYVSAADMGAVLTSILQRDGRILREDTANPLAPVMQTRALGLDISNAFWMEKNGGWSGCSDDGCGQIGTSAAIYLGGTGNGAGPAMVGVLFLNSDVDADGNPTSARGILQQAYQNALEAQ